MKNYTVTVNGKVYDVTVEEKGESKTPQTEVVKSSYSETKAVSAAPKAVKEGSGRIKVTAGAAGKIFKVETSAGQKVKRGAAILIIEAMKMEIPVVAPEDGVIASIDASVGDAVEAGQVLATMN